MTLDSDLLRQLDNFYVQHEVQDTAHRTVLSYLHMEPPRPITEAAQRSRYWAEDTCKKVLCVSDYESAIADMMARDLVWEMDVIKQSLIRNYLDSAPALGPTDGVPTVGTLQISVPFAELVDEFWADAGGDRSGRLWSRDWQSEYLSLIYSPTRNGCLDFLRDELMDDTVNIDQLSGPNRCGPWRSQWWRRYETGYVLDVHYLQRTN